MEYIKLIKHNYFTEEVALMGIKTNTTFFNSYIYSNLLRSPWYNTLLSYYYIFWGLQRGRRFIYKDWFHFSFQTVIDYLKFDIEGSEWETFRTMLKDGSLRQVKQIAFEMHNYQGNSVHNLRRYWSIITALENLGFQVWNWFPNMDTKRYGYRKSKLGRLFTPLINIHYVNVNFL